MSEDDVAKWITQAGLRLRALYTRNKIVEVTFRLADALGESPRLTDRPIHPADAIIYCDFLADLNATYTAYSAEGPIKCIGARVGPALARSVNSLKWDSTDAIGSSLKHILHTEDSGPSATGPSTELTAVTPSTASSDTETGGFAFGSLDAAGRLLRLFVHLMAAEQDDEEILCAALHLAGILSREDIFQTIACLSAYRDKHIIMEFLRRLSNFYLEMPTAEKRLDVADWFISRAFGGSKDKEEVLSNDRLETGAGIFYAGMNDQLYIFPYAVVKHFIKRMVIPPEKASPSKWRKERVASYKAAKLEHARRTVCPMLEKMITQQLRGKQTRAGQTTPGIENVDEVARVLAARVAAKFDERTLLGIDCGASIYIPEVIGAAGLTGHLSADVIDGLKCSVHVYRPQPADSIL